MRLPERFVLTIDGNLANARTRAIIVPNELPYLLALLLSGRTIGDSALEGYGFRVTIEVDQDQSDDEPVDLAPRGPR